MFGINNKMISNIMQQQALNIIPKVHRAECDDNPVVFLKAVRATLLALGYDEDFIEGDFRKQLEDYYYYPNKDDFD